MRVTITKEDIQMGKLLRPRSCPVARALRRAGCRKPSVCHLSIGYTYHGQEHFCVRVPRAVASFIIAFDSGKPVRPFSFTLHLTTS